MVVCGLSSKVVFFFLRQRRLSKLIDCLGMYPGCHGCYDPDPGHWIWIGLLLLLFLLLVLPYVTKDWKIEKRENTRHEGTKESHYSYNNTCS